VPNMARATGGVIKLSGLGTARGDKIIHGITALQTTNTPDTMSPVQASVSIKVKTIFGAIQLLAGTTVDPKWTIWRGEVLGVEQLPLVLTY